MKLKDIIGNTESTVKKAKKVKENINLTLVENGGENAINLTDVPNKMVKISENYKRIALGEFQVNAIKTKNVITVPLNLVFTPDLLVVEIKSRKTGDPTFTFDLSTSASITFNDNGAHSVKLKIVKFQETTKDHLKLYFEFRETIGYDLIINWTAIG